MVPWLYVTWFIISHLLCSCISFIYVTYITWLRDLFKLHSATSTKILTTNKITTKWEYIKQWEVAYPHVTWPNHAKVIKATAPKVVSMKGTYLNRPRDLWLHDILKNEKLVLYLHGLHRKNIHVYRVEI